jgi:hypothetical protein
MGSDTFSVCSNGFKTFFRSVPRPALAGGRPEAIMRDFFLDAGIAAALTLAFTAVVLILHHTGLLYN